MVLARHFKGGRFVVDVDDGAGAPFGSGDPEASRVGKEIEDTPILRILQEPPSGWPRVEKKAMSIGRVERHEKTEPVVRHLDGVVREIPAESGDGCRLRVPMRP